MKLENCDIVGFSYRKGEDLDLAKLKHLCEKSEFDPSPAARNMSLIDWENRSETLFHCLLEEERFAPGLGKLFAVEKEGQLIATSGVYAADFNPAEIAIGAVRTYTLPGRRDRFWHGELLIPAQIEWARKRGFKMFVVSFNNYNSRLYRFMKRALEGRACVFGLTVPEVYKQFIPHENEVLIKNTWQRVLKIPLQEGYDWNFSDYERKGEKVV